MGKPKHFITIARPPGGRILQVCYLQMDGIPDWYGQDYSVNLFQKEVFFGPFLMDMSTGTVVPAKVRTFTVEQLYEADGINQENTVNHSWVQGQLQSFAAVWECKQDEYSYSVWNAHYRINQTNLFSIDAQGKKLNHLLVYDALSTESHELRTDVYTFFSEEISVNGLPEAIGSLGGQRALSVMFNRIPGECSTEMESEELWQSGPEIGFREPIDPQYPMWLPDVGPFKYRWIRDRRPDTHSDEIGERWCRPIFVSPVFQSPIDDGSEVHDPSEVAIRERCQAFMKTISQRTFDRNAASQAAIDAIKAFRLCNVNGIAYLKDVVSILSVFTPLIRCLKNPRSWKNWSSLLLSLRYGLPLTWKDTVRLFGGLTRFKKLRKSLAGYATFRNSLQSHYGTGLSKGEVIDSFRFTRRDNVRICARREFPSGTSSALEGLVSLVTDLGFRITAVNAWDLVPYSFVVDWILDVSALLEKVDYSLEVFQYRIRETVRSSNVLGNLDASFFGDLHLYGALSFEDYSRMALPFFPSLSWGLDMSIPSNMNVADGILLTLQRSSK